MEEGEARDVFQKRDSANAGKEEKLPLPQPVTSRFKAVCEGSGHEGWWWGG